MSTSIGILDSEYLHWLKDLCKRYRRSQIKAAVAVNDTMLKFYWSLGRDIVMLKAESRWGSKFMANLSRDLKQANPDATCFSQTNLLYMKNFYRLYHSLFTDYGCCCRSCKEEFSGPDYFLPGKSRSS